VDEEKEGSRKTPFSDVAQIVYTSAVRSQPASVKPFALGRRNAFHSQNRGPSPIINTSRHGARMIYPVEGQDDDGEAILRNKIDDDLNPIYFNTAFSTRFENFTSDAIDETCTSTL
jgi:hypothetical protein